MIRKRSLIASAIVLAGAVATIHLGVRARPAAAAPRPTPAQLLDANIAFYEGVARRDPTGALAPGTLAIFYMRRARATGDYQDVLRAEECARRSIANRGAHNTRAHQALASSLLSEHRFTDALTISRDLSDADPSNAALRASLGEVQMELGQYDSARASFASVAGQTHDLSVAPRLARWAELQGRPDESYRLLNESLQQIIARQDVPAEQQAWFWLRIGDVQFRRGSFSEARNDYERGLEVHAEDYRLLAALAKVEAAQRHWQSAIDYGARAVAVNLDPATLGTMSDAYAALGDSVRANDFAHAMEVAVSRQATAYHRAWSLFLLDHGRRVDFVLARSQQDLASRRDIYGYDVVAWALHRKGRDEEAHAMMAHALALGTQDEMLFYHAAMIDAALGHARESAGEMDRARAIDPSLYVADAK